MKEKTNLKRNMTHLRNNWDSICAGMIYSLTNIALFYLHSNEISEKRRKTEAKWSSPLMKTLIKFKLNTYRAMCVQQSLDVINHRMD